ncbi:hypothetical protein FEI15_09270 [Lacticaseibacillus zeae]|uniref:Neutral/alkaline non-lysosomal ceramidase N-terminal domain-containing protein n=1 Tax=Lacticaseibacillus zeae TaxID=57037 RepID=A0A5R8LNP0_LACZE|nr:hypothetical protein [Lacticaseibacillus zeae]TLF38847.1 hypothetical protein FEI15_09270 [Lacticaseibacillus zeae]
MSARYTIGFAKEQFRISPHDFPLENYVDFNSPLYVRCFVLKGDPSLSLLSVEMTSLPTWAIKRLQKTVSSITEIPVKNIWISVTHSFSSPHLPNDEKRDPHRYHVIWEALKKSVQAAVVQANRAQQSFTLGRGVIQCPVNVNRNVQTRQGWWLGRNFDEYSNHEVRVFAFKLANGQMSLLFNYDLQSSVFDHLSDQSGMMHIDHDLVGEAAAMFEAKRPGSIGIFLPGAAGDQRPLLIGSRGTTRDQNQWLCTQQAKILKECLEQVVQNIQNWQQLYQVSSFQSDFKVPQKTTKVETFKLKPKSKAHFTNLDRSLSISLNGWHFNDWTILGTQPELNSAFGEKCRKQLHDDHAMLATLINGAIKYLPEQKDFDRITYQAQNAFIGIGADQIFLQNLKK